MGEYLRKYSVHALPHHFHLLMPLFTRLYSNSYLLFALSTCLALCAAVGRAQNVGIGSPSPMAKLEVNGNLALREGTLTLTNGANTVTLPTTGAFSFYKIVGPTAAFNITSISNPNDGQIVTLYNSTSQPMTIVNGSTISTQTGTNVTTVSAGVVVLQYSASTTKWVVTATQNTLASGTSGTLSNGAGIATLSYNGSTNTTLALATSGIAAGTYGSATTVPQITFDTYGRATSVTNVATGAGSVTSVGLTLPSIFTVSGSPVTSSGTLSAALATQSANAIFAGPSSGSTAGTPAFRPLVAADMPDLSSIYIKNQTTQQSAANYNISGSGVIGGTLTLSPMTLGSVFFAGTGGVVSQNNTNFFWDNPNTRLGIGTSSPAYALQVKTATANYGMSHTDGTISVATYVGGSTSGGWFGTVSNHPLSLYTNGSSSQLYLGTNGNVGIGSGATNPTNRLLLQPASLATASSASTYALAIANTSTVPDLTLGTDANYGYLQTWNTKPLVINGQGNNVGIGATPISESRLVLGAMDAANEGGQIQLNAPGGSYTTAHFIDNYQNNLRVLTGTNTGSATVRMNIDNSGNVKIPSLAGTGTRDVYADASGTLLTANAPTGGNVQTYTSGGSNTFTVPANVTQLKVYMIGAGGGGVYCGYNCGNPGSGGWVTGILPVTPGEVLTIGIGYGGAGVNSNGYSGGGGGTYIKRSGTLLCAAGGGGGGSYADSNSQGGGGGSGFGSYGGNHAAYGTSYDGNGGSGANGSTQNASGGSSFTGYLLYAQTAQGQYYYYDDARCPVPTTASNDAVYLTYLAGSGCGIAGQGQNNSGGYQGGMVLMW